MRRLRIRSDGHLWRFNNFSLADESGIRHELGDVLSPGIGPGYANASGDRRIAIGAQNNAPARIAEL